MTSVLKQVLRDDEGATMVEYGVMVALVAAICIAVVGALGQNVSNTFSSINASL